MKRRDEKNQRKGGREMKINDKNDRTFSENLFEKIQKNIKKLESLFQRFVIILIPEIFS